MEQGLVNYRNKRPRKDPQFKLFECDPEDIDQPWELIDSIPLNLDYNVIDFPEDYILSCYRYTRNFPHAVFVLDREYEISCLE